MAVTMSWSTSWCHYSATDSEVCGLGRGGGLFRSWCATTSVALAAAAGGGGTAVVAERRHCLTSEVAAAVVARVWPPTHRVHPTLDREVASPSISCSQRKG
jgi:hypothetical protein